MRKPVPTATEVSFGPDELFFSKTDATGRIQFGNEVFVRVSGYAADQLIGAPHSLVRHPDMPRSIFKLFWTYLKSGRPVAAFVKNMTAKGEYYWVLAVACPVSDGFLSIRLKPASKYFAAAKDLYGTLLKAETTEKMDEVYARLTPRLQALGFNDYDDFMTQAFRAELELRDQRDGPAERTTEHRYDDLESITGEGLRTFKTLFAHVDAVQRTNATFTERTARTLAEFNRLGFLSLNMLVAAEKFGERAAALSVIAENFQRRANVIEECVRSFESAAELVTSGIRTSNFNISSLRLQMDMVNFFIHESMKRGAFADINATRTDFLALADRSARDLEASLSTLLSKIKLAEREVTAIGGFVSHLEMIRVAGWVEASRRDELTNAFASQIDGLAQFTGEVRTALARFEDELTTLRGGVGAMSAAAARSAVTLKLIFDAVLTRAGAA